MCGVYSFKKIDKFQERFGVDFDAANLHELESVFPSFDMPVIRMKDGEREVVIMKWGIPRFIGPGKVKDVFNARDDKAFWSWKKLTMMQRILVPATGYYEWQKRTGGKQKYFIQLKDEELFSFAGIWAEWKGEDGKPINTYSIITTDPNEELHDIHNRMPVILHESDEDGWLSEGNNNDKEALEAYLHPYDDGKMTATQTS